MKPWRTHLLLIQILGILLLVAPLNAADLQRPNILWLSIEDISAEWGCYGDAYATTPNIDKLAQQSIRYANAFAEAPMCAPSRSAIITGVHTGPLGTSAMRSNHPIPASVRGFPALLREAGYHCLNNVKTDYNVGDEAAMIRDAWDGSSNTAHWRECPPGKPFFCVINYMDTHQSRSSRDDYADFQNKVQSRLSADEIHDPAKAPLPPFYPDTTIARRTVARYHDCITTLDHFVGGILAELESDGLADNTIVFLFSDHGAGLPGGKAVALDYGLRIPMLVRVPERCRHFVPADTRAVTDRVVSFVDFGPTVLNLAGVSVPSHMHGIPFLGNGLPEPRQYARGTRDRMDETLEVTRWISDGRYHLVRRYDTRAPLDQQTLLSHYNGNGELCQEIRRLKKAGQLTEDQLYYWGDTQAPVLLFDTKVDRWCRNNLAQAPEHAERLATLMKELESSMIKELDLGFWPEPDRVEAEQGVSAWERARQGDVYPLERILAVAKLVGDGVHRREELEQALNDADGSVRYWAVVGLAALGKEVLPSLDRLQMSMDDSAVSVRLAAAETVAFYGNATDSGDAIAYLVQELNSQNEWVACRAARSLELLGHRAKPSMAAIHDAYQRRKSGFFGEAGPDPIQAAFEFSLRTALDQLQ